MQLYNFWRSGSSHRLRIALNLKGLPYDYLPVHLGKGEHLSDRFKALNPQQLVPALVVEGQEQPFIQSPAIIEWLEEAHPSPALLPSDLRERAHVRALAALVGCDIHPINNRRILEYLRHELGADEAAINAWCGQWIRSGLQAYEDLLASSPYSQADKGRFSCGDSPTVADVYLIPQLESARRFGVDLSAWPRITAVEQACLQLPAFAQAAPAVQIDAAP
ncbi:MAG: maleylacetoacetate isomerase [Comamonas sp.]|nr:maleylacetoacetate isomerase [Comamonas sp.]